MQPPCHKIARRDHESHRVQQVADSLRQNKGRYCQQTKRLLWPKTPLQPNSNEQDKDQPHLWLQPLLRSALQHLLQETIAEEAESCLQHVAGREFLVH